MGRSVTEHKGNALVGLDGEFAYCTQLFAAQRSRRLEQQHLRSGNGAQRTVLEPRHPRNGGAVIEPDNELATHGYAAFKAANETHDIASLAFWRHEVDQKNAAFLGFEGRLENERIAAVTSRRLGRCRWSDQPAAIFRLAQEGRKAGIGIKLRQA